jgi:hypothetical protein
MVRAFAEWLSGTDLSWAARGGLPWVWPACETLHFMGMALLIGTVGLIDLRVLGLLRGLSTGPLERLVPWALLAFAVNLATGFVFFAGEPFQYIDNNVFWAKLLFILLAGVNAGLFYVTGLARRSDAMGPDDESPPAAKVIAATSLFLWFGVIFWGRMLPFLDGAF